ncbi:hypothetical protein L810_4397 [Burkholderia sp. AU4i]|nr:hypothetical protein L810_4397 [Burkholderia sp. AU4i]MDW9228108.1 hypothetical protein [Burkholderia cepacia]MDW9243215.1 hypothetical protein [Burkholderia cepacia]QOH34708.1 hypothetical protein C7S14_5214 [Burkholderia cepacia]
MLRAPRLGRDRSRPDALAADALGVREVAGAPHESGRHPT